MVQWYKAPQRVFYWANEGIRGGGGKGKLNAFFNTTNHPSPPKEWGQGVRESGLPWVTFKKYLGQKDTGVLNFIGYKCKEEVDVFFHSSVLITSW